MSAATGERGGRLDRHPTVVAVRARQAGAPPPPNPAPLDAAALRELCLAAGADDMGFVEITRPELADQKADIEAAFPRARTLIGFVCRMNRENIRTPARSVANLEFHHTTDHTNDVARRIVEALGRRGVRAVNGGAAGFPMEMDRFPGRSGSSPTSRWRWRPASGGWASTATSSIPGSATSYCSAPSSSTPPSTGTPNHSTSTPASIASSAWPPAPAAPSAPRATSTSPPATRTTTGSSWAASAIGWNRSPAARAVATTGHGSPTPRRRRCGRASRSAPTTRPPTACRSARPART